MNSNCPKNGSRCFQNQGILATPAFFSRTLYVCMYVTKQACGLYQKPETEILIKDTRMGHSCTSVELPWRKFLLEPEASRSSLLTKNKSLPGQPAQVSGQWGRILPSLLLSECFLSCLALVQRKALLPSCYSNCVLWRLTAGLPPSQNWSCLLSLGYIASQGTGEGSVGTCYISLELWV